MPAEQMIHTTTALPISYRKSASTENGRAIHTDSLNDGIIIAALAGAMNASPLCC